MSEPNFMAIQLIVVEAFQNYKIKLHAGATGKVRRIHEP